MTSPSIVLCMDTSGSMSYQNYIQSAQTDASTFVNIMNIGDSLGVSWFNTSSGVVYPSVGATSVGVLSAATDQTAATNAIMGLSVTGVTDMSAGIGTSAGLLSGAPAPTAIVMLSDGEWNWGNNPINSLPSIPIYTIALGSNGQLQTLQTIATTTGGTYHYSPTPFNLMDIYNEIVGQTQVASVLANQPKNLAQNNFWTLSSSVPSGLSKVKFAITWTNWAVAYTSGTPTGNQINVSFQDPSGTSHTYQPYAQGNGFVTFEVPNPAAGTWKAAIWSSASGTLGTNGASFNPSLSTNLGASMPASSNVAAQVPVTAEMTTDGTPMEGVKYSATLEAPLMTHEEAAEHHKDALEETRKDLSGGDEEPTDHQVFNALQMKAGPGTPLLPYESQSVEVHQDGHKASISFEPRVAGGHILRVVAEGRHPKTGEMETRTRRLSTWAVDG